MGAGCSSHGRKDGSTVENPLTLPACIRTRLPQDSSHLSQDSTWGLELSAVLLEFMVNALLGICSQQHGQEGSSLGAGSHREEK